MSDAPITQAALDREVQNLSDLMAAHDRRYEQRFKDSQAAVDAALAAARTAVDAALTSAKEAVQKAETASEKRFEGVNEFRETLADQQRTLMPRSEAELRFNALEAKVDALTKAFMETRAQKVGGRDTWNMLLAALAAFATIAAIVEHFKP